LEGGEDWLETTPRALFAVEGSRRSGPAVDRTGLGPPVASLISRLLGSATEAICRSFMLISAHGQVLGGGTDALASFRID